MLRFNGFSAFVGLLVIQLGRPGPVRVFDAVLHKSRLQLLTCQPQTALGRRQICLQDLRDFRQAQPGKMMQGKRQPLFFRQFGQQSIDQAGQFPLIGMGIRRDHAGNDGTQRLLIVIRAAAGMDQGIAGMSSKRIDEQVPRHAEQPAAESPQRQIIPRLIVDLEQGFLREIFSELAVSGVGIKEAKQYPLVALHELLERMSIVLLDLDHERVVINDGCDGVTGDDSGGVTRDDSGRVLAVCVIRAVPVGPGRLIGTRSGQWSDSRQPANCLEC